MIFFVQTTCCQQCHCLLLCFRVIGQLSQLRGLMQGDEDQPKFSIRDNYRPTMPLNQRPIRTNIPPIGQVCIAQCRLLFLHTSGEFVYGTPTYTSSYVLWGNSDPKSSGDQSLLSSLSVLSSSFLLPVSSRSRVKRISYRPSLSAALRLLALNKAHAYAIGF